MTALEKIQKEIKTLPPSEQFSLWKSLGHDLETILEADSSLAEKEWDTEISSRVKDVEEGRVKLLSMEEADIQTAELFSRLGIDRKRRSS